MNNLFVPLEYVYELKSLCFTDFKPYSYYNLYSNKEYSFDEYIDEICWDYYEAPLWLQVYDWFEKEHGLYVEWQIDGWENDDYVTDKFICYRVFIWEVGKPKPHYTEDLGAGTRDQMNPIVIKHLINILKTRNGI